MKFVWNIAVEFLGVLLEFLIKEVIIVLFNGDFYCGCIGIEIGKGNLEEVDNCYLLKIFIIVFSNDNVIKWEVREVCDGFSVVLVFFF